MNPTPEWVWIAAVLMAALAQTLRNTAQRSLTDAAGPVGASLARFLYGLPFALLCALAAQALFGVRNPLPDVNGTFWLWMVVGALTHALGSVCLMSAMRSGSFVVAVALSKTEVVQIALFATAILAEAPNAFSVAGMVFALSGAVMLSARGKGALAARADRRQLWLSTFYGVATGACYAMAAVGYRAAGLELTELGHPAVLVACWCVFIAQTLQVASLGLWLLARERQALRAIFTDWRLSTAAGFAGSLASVGWYIGYVLRPAADVRILGMVEVVFSYLVSRHLLGERPQLRENVAIALVVVGAIFACL